MEIRLLKYFLEVIKQGTISAAADSLHITQPTLSRQLKNLEENLNTILFIRGSKNIELTENGLLLKKRAEEIILLLEKTQNDINNNNLIQGDIYIGAGETDGIRFLAPIIKKIQEDFPYIQFHIFSGNSEDLIEKLDNGIIDFSLTIGALDFKNYNYIQLPLEDHWGLLVHNSSPLANLEFITPKDLLNIPLFVSRQPLVKNQISGWLGFDYNKLNIIGTYNLLYNTAILIEEGIGYGLCLDKIINTFNSNLSFKPLYPKLNVPINIIWKKDFKHSTASNYFLTELYNHL